MGWKGTMRSVTASVRRMEKEAQRRHKQDIKEQISSDATEAVTNWETYLDELLSVHTDLADRIDWQSMLSKPKPNYPETISQNQDQATNAIKTFKPKMFSFLTGSTAKRKAALEQNLLTAPEKDRVENDKLHRKYEAALADWESDRSLAKRLSDEDSTAIQEVLNEFQTLTEHDLIGSSVQFEIWDGVIHAVPQVHSDEVVPNFRRKQLASGQLSQTKMPIGQFNELYQDYVASVALKVAGDMFQILPINEVYVTCESKMLNSSTGHMQPTAILSVQFVRATFETLNLDNIDPSDSMMNFNHVMKFNKTKGFSAVAPLVSQGQKNE
jgi:hypothetical protein